MTWDVERRLKTTDLTSYFVFVWYAEEGRPGLGFGQGRLPGRGSSIRERKPSNGRSAIKLRGLPWLDLLLLRLLGDRGPLRHCLCIFLVVLPLLGCLLLFVLGLSCVCQLQVPKREEVRPGVASRHGWPLPCFFPFVGFPKLPVCCCSREL